jgi:transcriptional regulator with XRE-family HTH domain/tetratricopeptide (TPR) repeat protein
MLRAHMRKPLPSGKKPPGKSWTQDELAEATEINEAGKTLVSRVSISRYLNGRDLPSDGNLMALCKVFFGRAPTGNAAQVKEAFVDLWQLACDERDDKASKHHLKPDHHAPAQQIPAAQILRPDRFLGRSAELEILVAALVDEAPCRAVVLGEGGMGKTTFTRRAATDRRVQAHFPGRVFEVELTTAKSCDAMQDLLARGLGTEPAKGMSEILAMLSEQPTLLLLDNLEAPWEAEPDAVETLLADVASTPRLSICVTLRGAEAPRRPAWTYHRKLEPLDRAESSALFREIAPLIHEDDPLLAQLVIELGGLPLAIELLAWLAAPDSSLRSVWTQWTAAGPAIADARKPEAHRHASLARSIEISLASGRMSEAGRRAFRLLCALPAGVAPEDEAALLGFTGSRELLAVALARRRDGRLDLLPPIRRHGSETSAPHAEEARAWVGHVLTLLCQEGEKVGGEGGAQASARLLPEHANIEAAMAIAEACGLREEAQAASLGYVRLAYFNGLHGSGLLALRDAARRSGDRLGEATCVLRLAEIALARSDQNLARTGYEEALRIHREVRSRSGEAICIERLADIALERLEYASARAGYMKARRIYGAIGDHRGEADSIKSLADIALQLSDYALAGRRYEDARRIYKAVGLRLGEANCIQSLGEIALRRSDHPLALMHYEAALPIFQEIGERMGEANCIKGLADIAFHVDGQAAAGGGYAKALAVFREISDIVGEGGSLAGLAQVSAAQGERAKAKALMDQAIALLDRSGSAFHLAEVRAIQGRLKL